MIFNGQHPDVIATLDEETFTNIQLMWADGVLGNRGTYEALKPITAGLANMFRADNGKVVKQEDIFPWVDEYFSGEVEDKTEQVVEVERHNKNSLAFMSFPGVAEMLEKAGVLCS